MHARLAPSLRRLATRAAVAAHFAAVAGCAVGTAEDVEDTQVVSGNLAAVSSSTALWNQNGNVVDICWSTSGHAAEKNKIRDAVEATWKANSGLTFNWPATTDTLCPNPAAANYMPIQVKDGTSYGGLCQYGYNGRLSASDCGTSAPCQCWVSTATDEPDPLTNQPNPMKFVAIAAVHEIGHGLGMFHEHQRADRPADIATTCSDTNTDPNKWNTLSYVVDNTLRLITTYDGTGSIMSYCREPNRDGATVIEAMTFSLGAMDRLGVEMLYPFNLSRQPILLGGIRNSSGSTTVVRTDVVTTLNVDWVARGALTSAFSNIHWKDGGGIFSSSASPSLTITTNRTIQLELDDVLGRHHSWTATNVIANNALYTAILLPPVL